MIDDLFHSLSHDIKLMPQGVQLLVTETGSNETETSTDSQALAGVPDSERCHCEHEEIPGRKGIWEVPKRKEGEGQGQGAKVQVAYE